MRPPRVVALIALIVPSAWTSPVNIPRRLIPNPRAPGGARIEHGEDAGSVTCLKSTRASEDEARRRFAGSSRGGGSLESIVYRSIPSPRAGSLDSIVRSPLPETRADEHVHSDPLTA